MLEVCWDIVVDFECEMCDDFVFFKEEFGMVRCEVFFFKEMVVFYGFGSFVGDVGVWVGVGVGVVQVIGKFLKVYVEMFGKYVIFYLYVGEYFILWNIFFGLFVQWFRFNIWFYEDRFQ